MLKYRIEYSYGPVSDPQHSKIEVQAANAIDLSETLRRLGSDAVIESVEIVEEPKKSEGKQWDGISCFEDYGGMS